VTSSNFPSPDRINATKSDSTALRRLNGSEKKYHFILLLAAVDLSNRLLRLGPCFLRHQSLTRQSSEFTATQDEEMIKLSYGVQARYVQVIQPGVLRCFNVVHVYPCYVGTFETTFFQQHVLSHVVTTDTCMRLRATMSLGESGVLRVFVPDALVH
jgi:hypothetical protein